MTKISTLHKRWMKDPAYKESFEAAGPEFELAQKLINARVKSGSDLLRAKWLIFTPRATASNSVIWSTPMPRTQPQI